MSVPIITVAQMRAWETATWQTGQTEAKVIHLVGVAVAQRVLKLTRPGEGIVLLAGKGHNGDDVRAACEHILDRRVDLLEVDSPADDLVDLEAALKQKPALIVDGLFGIGLDRPLDDEWKKFISRLNAARVPVLAVDVPSGLNADTGQTFGAAVEAAVTLTVGAPKRGLLAPGAEQFVGRLEVADEVGLSPCAETSELNWMLPQDFAAFPPRRPAAGHKGAFGHLGIIAGSVGFHGAAVLATRGAQRAQPGLVTLFVHEPVYHAIAPQLQAAMVKLWDAGVKFATEFTATLIGPGLAANDLPADMKLVTRKLWRDSLLPVIVDASALDWLPLDPVPRGAIRVLTPHPGEAARLLKSTAQHVQVNRTHALREISKSFGNSWVVLKGYHTLIGRSSGEIFVNPTGNPHLAQGGSGDLLAGFIAGLLAQPALQADVAATLRYAVWQHGAAADALQSRRGHWIIEDLAAELGSARP
ncbi:MAG: NAD(P)H-hydrate dehydratase [Pedosphaera sp.]|nr:NAD(P)H-hydrate dehydratase [Pedosphaera sp.]